MLLGVGIVEIVDEIASQAMASNNPDLILLKSNPQPTHQKKPTPHHTYHPNIQKIIEKL